eukprot:5093473-Prymnesium_polylepis.1
MRTRALAPPRGRCIRTLGGLGCLSRSPAAGGARSEATDFLLRRELGDVLGRRWQAGARPRHEEAEGVVLLGDVRGVDAQRAHRED